MDLIPSNTEVSIIEIDDDWGKVIYGETVGWISLDYVDYESSFNYLPGDVNNDGLVNIQDVFVISQKLKSGTPFTQNEVRVADFNDDGVINSTDYIVIKNIILF